MPRRFQAGEIHFNLMAVVEDKMQRLGKQEEVLKAAGDVSGLAQVRSEMERELRRRSEWARDNVRRRHNYLPFIVELLRGLAAEGKLTDVYEAARAKVQPVLI